MKNIVDKMVNKSKSGLMKALAIAIIIATAYYSYKGVEFVIYTMSKWL